jgi:cytochrome c peroxidase
LHPKKKKRKEASCHMVKETFENKIPIKSPHFEEKMNNAFTAPTFFLEKLSRFLAF